MSTMIKLSAFTYVPKNAICSIIFYRGGLIKGITGDYARVITKDSPSWSGSSSWMNTKDSNFHDIKSTNEPYYSNLRKYCENESQ